MSPQELAEAYLDALGRADLATMLSLFSNGGLATRRCMERSLPAHSSRRCSAIRRNRG
jgi:hypothetical protein